jgi:hypothetical protein
LFPWITAHTQAAAEGANAVALLAGPPAAGRRLTLTLKQRTTEAGYPDVFDSFLRLIGADTADGHDLPEWISAWSRAFELASQNSADPRVAGCRLRYHMAGFEALNLAGWPQAVVWGLLSTWQIGVELTFSEGGASRSEWDGFLKHLDLDQDAVERRTQDLERFLDGVEEILDRWAAEHGA